jgi:hypothetical protein
MKTIVIVAVFDWFNFIVESLYEYELLLGSLTLNKEPDIILIIFRLLFSLIELI